MTSSINLKAFDKYEDFSRIFLIKTKNFSKKSQLCGNSEKNNYDEATYARKIILNYEFTKKIFAKDLLYQGTEHQINQGLTFKKTKQH